MIFIYIYLIVGVINCIVVALGLTTKFVEETKCSEWKNRWIPVIILLWLPIVILAVGIHTHSVLRKQS